jgi:aerobic carbon-monoxide dehydrogenase medium subunit
MKPAPFEYLRAASVDEAVRALSDADGDGKILAGGQSLVPLMALRMARPTLVVDVNRIPGLAGITRTGSSVRIGALTRHRDLVEQRELPLLAEAAAWIGHAAIRSRGTVGGSVAHADPAAEIPVVATALDAIAEVAGPHGVREVPAANLFTGPLQTSLADDEMITWLRLSVPRRWAFAEFSRRHGDFGLVTVVAAQVAGRTRIAVGGAGGVPLRVAEAEDSLAGAALTADAIDRAAAVVAAGVHPMDDVHATAAYRQALAEELTRRALGQLIGERGAT